MLMRMRMDADEEVSLREQRPCIYITEVVLTPRSFWLLGIIESWHSTDASGSREQKSYDGSLRGLEIPQVGKSLSHFLFVEVIMHLFL